MKRLQYKSAIFEKFELLNDNPERYADQNTDETSVKPYGGGTSYVCPDCIKEYGLHSETGLSKKSAQEIILGGEQDDFICSIEGCLNYGAYKASLRINKCKLID